MTLRDKGQRIREKDRAFRTREMRKNAREKGNDTCREDRDKGLPLDKQKTDVARKIMSIYIDKDETLC